MTGHDDYIKRYPNARTSTLAFLAKRDETTKQLRDEIEAMRKERKDRPQPSFFQWLMKVAR